MEMGSSSGEISWANAPALNIPVWAKAKVFKSKNVIREKMKFFMWKHPKTTSGRLALILLVKA
jgi:hypothetical protein